MLDFNKKAEEDFDIDKKIDQEIYRIATTEKNVIIESHIGGWLLKNIANLTVYLNASIETRAKRISIRDNISFYDALDQIIKREESHFKRFLFYYGIDITDLSVFDLVINSDFISPDDVTKIIETVLLSLKTKNIH